MFIIRKQRSFRSIIYHGMYYSNTSGTDIDSTTDSNRPSYMDKFDNINKILSELETKCIS
jgi:hypothetical protein